MLETEDEFIEHIKSVKYLVIFPDTSCKMYFTLREVADDISIDHTTIYKHLKNDVHCFCEFFFHCGLENFLVIFSVFLMFFLD